MVDVEASFVADCEAAEAVQPGKGSLDDPAMASKLLAGLDAASCDTSLDASSLAGLAASTEVIGFVGMQLGGSASGSASLASDGRDGIQQFVEGLAVVNVGLGQQEGERDALPVGDEVAFGLRPAPVGRVRAGRLTPPFRCGGRAVQAGSAPIEPVRLMQTAQQFTVQLVPDTCRLPIPQPPPARHSGAARHLLRQHLPWYASSQHEQNTGQRSPVVDTGTATESVRTRVQEF